MNHVVFKYCGILGTRLERYKVKSTRPFRSNMRCPLCGDSHSNKSKARGWLLENKSGSVTYYCHNCGASHSFHYFLKLIDSNLFNEYILEETKEKYLATPRKKTDVEIFADKMKTPIFIKNSPLDGLKKISQLAHNHPAKQYIDSRKIPADRQYKLYYTSKFKAFINSIIKDKFKDLTIDEPRLIIPFFDENKKMFGLQGRSFRKNDKTKYITIMFDESKSKIYGLDSCDMKSQYFILEGPIDSLFVNNSVAMAGSSLDYNYIDKTNAVFVYDNEPRKKETIQKMERVIDMGYKIVIWPDNISEKDVNDMILKNSNFDIMFVLCNNIFSGAAAKMKLTTWKKTNVR